MTENRTLFPLPLTPFEEYLATDDNPAFPMVFTIRLRFQGRVDQTRLEQAQRCALARHPLLTSTIRRVSRFRHVWEPRDIPATAIRLCNDAGARELPTFLPTQLTDEYGLRTTIVSGSTHDDLVCQFHHVCCDGHGAFVFLEDLLLAYHFVENQTALKQALRPLDQRWLTQRGKRRLSLSDRLGLLAKPLLAMEGTRRFFLRRAAPIVNQHWPDVNSHVPVEYPTVLSATLSTNEVEQIRSVARASGATSHEVLTRDLFVTLHEFQRNSAKSSTGGWIRLNIPVNLRRREHQRIPASNIVSMVFLDRRARQIEEPTTLLRGIHNEMSFIKRFDVKYAFVYGAHLLRATPALYEGMRNSRRCFATAVLTNLGSVLDNILPVEGQQMVVGDLRLCSVALAPPYRPLCGAAIALTKFAGRMTICLHYDPRALASDEAQTLLRGYLDRIRDSINQH